MIDDAEIAILIEQVTNDLDLSLSDLLGLFQRRVNIPASQLAILADVDVSAFNKALKSKEGRLLNHEQIETLVNEFVVHSNYDLPRISYDEASLWLMALQSAAAADNNIAAIRKRNRFAEEDQLRQGRRRIVETMRELWTETGGSLPCQSLAPQSGKLTLTWRESPRDLDLYLKISAIEGEIIVSYGQRGNLDSFPWASLNADIRTGFGPEIITIERLLKGKYYGAVHNCSSEVNLGGCEAEIEVAFDSMKRLLRCPSEGNGRWWLIFVLDTATGGIEYVNQITDVPWPDSNPIIGLLERWGPTTGSR